MTVGVLVTAFGFLESLDDVADYLARISGRTPRPEAVAELRARYEAIGGPGPLARITREQVAGLAQELGDGYVVRLGCRHSEPGITEAARELAGLAETLVVLALAPQDNTHSVRVYLDEAREALAELADPPKATYVASYATHPDLVGYWAEAVMAARDRLPPALRDGAHVLFTAHGLPRSILEAGDPYPDECHATAAAVAEAAGVARWSLAYQSGRPGWLGPDVGEALESLAADAEAVVVAPVGFVSEHLETLYDLDVELAAHARELGVTLERAPAPGASPRFLTCLADLVRRNAS